MSRSNTLTRRARMAAVAAQEASAPVASAPTNRATMLDLLQRPEGATIAEIMAATGWLPHSTRAALSSLRRKGHAIARASKAAGVAAYRIVVQPQ